MQEYDHLHMVGDDETSPHDDRSGLVHSRDQFVDITVPQGGSGSFVDNLKLGAIPAPPDPRTLRLEDFLLPAMAPPAVFSNSNRVSPWGMLKNDQEGNCVIAGIGHADMLWSILANMPNRPTDAEISGLYRQLTGGPDSGLVILNALKHIKKYGFEGRPVLGYAHVDPRNTVLSKTAISMFGAVLRGILLPNSAKPQTGPGLRWAVPAAGDPNGALNSWGGHLTLDTGYDVTNFETVTWGQVQRVQPEFYVRYSMESWVLIPTYPVPGFDHVKFRQALLDLGTQVDVDPIPVPPPQPTPAPGFDITQVSDDALEAEFYRRTGGWGDLDISIGFKKWTKRWQGRFHEG